MADLPEVQDRSRRLFEDLLRRSGRAPRAPGAEAEAFPSAPGFSVFDPEQAAAASELALGLSVVAAAATDLVDGLDDALTQAGLAAQTEDPELVHHALSLFVTHSTEGRRLVMPRPVIADPAGFLPSTFAADGPTAALEVAVAGSTGVERHLDFWREDSLANEHHQHWHQVYPFSGIFPSDWPQWAELADRQALLELFQKLDPSQNWQTFLQSARPAQVADEFVRRAEALRRQDPDGWRQYLNSLSALAYGTLFHLNDRHGELFFYMHQQMLARYNAERLAHDLDPVVPLSDLDAPIAEGTIPGPP